MQVYNHPDQLPSLWDDIAKDNPFLMRESLTHLHQVNPCHQRYYLGEEGFVYVKYRKKVNALTFFKNFSMKINLSIIGIPMSVSSPGYAFKASAKQAMVASFYKSSFWSIVLNSPDELGLPWGQTLPDYLLTLKGEEFEDYMTSLRSHYRYRIQKAIKKGHAFNIKVICQSETFDEKDYRLYESTFSRAQYPLEKLSIDFFKQYPAKIIRISLHNSAVGFIQYKVHKQTLYFMFCGFHEKTNHDHDLYINLLITLVKAAYQEGCTKIDFGQTTETTKMKLGAEKVDRKLYVTSRHKMIKHLAKWILPHISYKSEENTFRVFREDESTGI